MDFTMIGTLHSYVQQNNLKFAANYKQKTGKSVVSSSGNMQLDLKAANNRSLVDKMIQAQQADKDEYSKQRVSSIRRKLLSGKKISNEELGYLKKNDPDLYKKAKKAEEAREELKADLRKAKTKAEARQAVTRALIKASAEATAEIKAAKGAVGGGGIGSGISGGVDGGNAAAGYQASQEIGGPNVESLFGNSANGGNEPSMVRLNEQINATTSEGSVQEAAAQEGAILKDINNEVSAAREVGAEAAKAESANFANSEESINDKSDSSNQTDSNAQNNSDNSIKTSPFSNNNSSKFAMSSIMEKFIMVVRAIEDEWMEFSKSDEYKDMPEDLFDEAETELNKKHKKKSHSYKPVEKPNQQVIEMISAYRSSMICAQNK